MFFGCTLMAPHGGVFVIAIVSNPLAYITAMLQDYSWCNNTRYVKETSTRIIFIS